MSHYRLFFKDPRHLADRAVANIPVISGKFGEDQENITTSTFNVLEIPGNIETGFFCGLYDAYGRIVYEGIVKQLAGNTIEARSLMSIFDNEIVWWDITGLTDVEEYMEQAYANYMQHFPMLKLIYADSTATIMTSTAAGGDLRVNDGGNQNIYDWFHEQHNAFGVWIYQSFPFGLGNMEVNFSRPTHGKVVIGDNAANIFNLEGGEDEVPYNALSVALLDNNGDLQSRARYSLLKDGSYYTLDSDTSLLFTDVKAKTFRVKAADFVSDMVKQQLPPLIHNHEITFDMLLENSLYDFYDWQLGQPMEVWKDGNYYDSVFTGWEMEFSDSQPATIVHITCGTSRTSLTEVLNDQK